jgi:hypothetical protein
MKSENTTKMRQAAHRSAEWNILRVEWRQNQ